VNAASQLEMTGEHVLRLQQALCRVPGFPAGLDRFAELFADPAVTLSDLIERVLSGGPDPGSALADEEPQATPDREPVAAPSGAARHEARQVLTAPALSWPSAEPVRPALRTLAAEPTASAADRAASPPPPQVTIATTRPGSTDVRWPAGDRLRADAGEADVADDADDADAGPAMGVSAADADAGPAMGVSAADAGIRPAMTRARRYPLSQGRLPASERQPPQPTPPHAITAPSLSPAPERTADAPAPPAAPARARLASGLPDLAAALQANVAAHDAGPRGAADAADPGSRGSRPPHQAPEVNPVDPNDPNVASAPDLRRLMERLATELELEFIRSYGTAGG
jgi:hypothetical protein